LIDFIAFNVIIDDIVFPDGKTSMGVLGGGGPQTAFGMCLWGASVGLAAGVGPDLPPAALEQLEGWGLDLAGLRRSDLPTPRAWQAMEPDGHRTQVWRVPPDVIGAQLAHRIDLLPPAYRRAKGFHLGVHPLEPDLDFITALRAAGAVASVEPFKPADRLPTPDELRRLLAACDLFSPNLEEAVSLVGSGAPEKLVARLLRQGATRVALHLGVEGSLVGEGSGRPVHIPAVPVKGIDPVGAGNAYCGGLLAGFVQTGSLVRAACMASVSASFLVEQVGCPASLDEDTRAEAVRRLQALELKLNEQ